MEQYTSLVNKKTIFYATGLLFIVVLLAVFSWIWNHAYISIDGSAYSGEKVFTITDSMGKPLYLERSTGSVKKLVKKGSYRIDVTQPQKSYVGFVEAPGLLRTKQVSPVLHTENARTFVGNNPSSCMYYVGERLYSLACGDYTASLLEHLPATDYTPTRTTPVQAGLYGRLIGMTTMANGKTVALLYSSKEDVPGFSFVTNPLDRLDHTVTLAKSLKPKSTYSLQAYKDGLIVYNTSQSEFWYFSSLSAPPKKIAPDPPKTPGLSGRSTSVQNGAVVSLYTNGALDAESSSPLRLTEARGTTEIIVSTDEGQKHAVLPYAYKSAVLCGKEKLCVIGMTGASVYDISGKKTKYLYTFPGVTSAFTLDSGEAKFVTKQGIMSYDPATASGYYNYVFGDYTSCGTNTVPQKGTYLLCAVNPLHDRVALLIQDAPVSATGPIDKQIVSLIKSPDIATASVYKNTVVIAPNYGDKPLSKTVSTWINANVQKDIKKSGISSSLYTINTVGAQ